MVTVKLMPREQIIHVQQRHVNNIFVRYNDAALVIQKAWKIYKKKLEENIDKEIEIILLKEISAQIIQDWWRQIKNNK